MSQLILPPLRRTAADAADVAAVIHKDGIDEAGQPFIGHLARVAASVRRLAEWCPFWSDDHRDDAEQVAWLHDVIGTAGATERRLRQEGFSLIVIEAVAALTPQEGKSYQDLINAIMRDGGLTTVLVKLADLDDTLDPRWLARLANDSRSKIERQYRAARLQMIEAAVEKGWQGSSSAIAPLQ
ncbi:metal-dependent phosphohydrolase [Methylobacterium sp. 391_Methyba4]|uniref:metal-dependent phosphohydrolase n=1 Tax=Methylobacterium sp. 391_Methyba4 TaxID=3038924 RepID=UPI00241D5432|nr:metal-dependent phosphohydrolase [Methylobacterium sp. 391_Methyba4]WFS09111.1 metal-dependent phosphohydrolase [Methylobacterium sp. 391_Methyba4]